MRAFGEASRLRVHFDNIVIINITQASLPAFNTAAEAFFSAAQLKV